MSRFRDDLDESGWWNGWRKRLDWDMLELIGSRTL